MSYSTEYKLELIENEFVVEHEALLLQMQLHDQCAIKNKDGYLIANILRVPNGYLYSYHPYDTPVFVPEFKHSPKPIR